MIHYTTYYDPDVQQEIVRVLGKPFGFRDIFKIGAVGSSRMKVQEYSLTFSKLIENSNDFAVASIGLRPKGLLVTVSKRDHNIIWTIPYYRLTIYKTDLLSIHADGHFLKLELKQRQNYKFIKKIIEHKIRFEKNFIG
jgi:hypothetical protein